MKMKKYIMLTLEIESEYPEELEDDILKETIGEALESELFSTPRSGKINSFEVHEAT